ncbi:MAG: PPOX class F420-dependent oxidoreductase [Thermomicrobiales bacterium]|nr:PPOX class F420-dependent oxidoreductase [Thermomicrobiales bacterium]
MPTIPASHRDLLQSAPVVILATKGADGYPQVSALWFIAETDGTVRMSINTARQKAKNLERDPEATIFFIDPGNPHHTMEIRGRAVIEPDPGYLLADRVGAKYGANLRDMDGPGQTRIAVTFVPVKINTFG